MPKNIDDIMQMPTKKMTPKEYREKRREQEKEKRRYPLFPFLIGCLPALVLLLGAGLLVGPHFLKSNAAHSLVTRSRTVHTSPVLLEGDGAVPNATLSLLNNGEEFSQIKADANGHFMFPVVLNPGTNTITVVGEAATENGLTIPVISSIPNPPGNGDIPNNGNDPGNTGGDGNTPSNPNNPGNTGPTTILTEIINYDPSGPFLQITNPGDGDTFTAPHIIVTGLTDPGATVVINGTDAPVASDGSFILPMTLSPGSNDIDATATNPNGTATDSITVTYNDNPGGGSGSTPPGGGSGSTPPGGSGSTPPGGSGSTPPGGSGSTPPGGGSGSTPPGGGSGSTPPGGSGSTPPGGSGSTPPGGVVIFPSKVIISKVLYTGDSPDGSLTEYVEIRNTGAGDEDISGWQVFDSNGNTFTFPSYSMAPGQVIRITTNQTIGFSYASTTPVWDHLGEPAYLKNGAGNLVDIYSYN